MIDAGLWMCVSCRTGLQKITCPCELIYMFINDLTKRAVNINVIQPNLCTDLLGTLRSVIEMSNLINHSAYSSRHITFGYGTSESRRHVCELNTNAN